MQMKLALEPNKMQGKNALPKQVRLKEARGLVVWVRRGGPVDIILDHLEPGWEQPYIWDARFYSVFIIPETII